MALRTLIKTTQLEKNDKLNLLGMYLLHLYILMKISIKILHFNFPVVDRWTFPEFSFIFALMIV